MSGDLVLSKIDGARKLLSEAKTIKEAKYIADMAEAARIYGKRIEASIETVNQAAELRIAAETLLGQMLGQTKKNTGAAGVGPIAVPEGNRNQEPTLKEIGVSKKLSSRAQKLASVPVEKIHEAIEQQKKEGREVTTTETMRRVKSQLPGEPVITVDAEAVEKASRESNSLFGLKNNWRSSSKRDRFSFLRWIKTNKRQYPYELKN